jgi:hypothetical protein
MIDFDKMVLAPLDKVFGQVVSYLPSATGEAFSLLGIFTDGYKTPSFDESGPVKWNTSAPTLGCRAADFPAAPVRNDQITIGDKQYMVMDARPDGVGWLILSLKAMQ